MTTRPAERQRRPSDEVQSLIVDAARELFRVKGYAGTTTKEIAVRAGVAEALLFTNFGTKAQLFERAVTEPFDEFVENYIRSWRESGDGASELDRLEGFIAGLMELTERNRGLLAETVTPIPDGASGITDSARAAVVRGVSRALQRIHALDDGPHPWTFEPTVMLAATNGLVMSTVLLDRILFPETGPPPRQTLISELARFMLYGLTGPDRT